MEVLRHADEIRLSTITLGELVAGFALGTREAANRQELSVFLDSPRVSTLPLGTETAGYYAAVFAQLRAQGRPIPTNDLWQAAAALENGLALATHDAHFDAVHGLLVVRRPEDLLP